MPLLKSIELPTGVVLPYAEHGHPRGVPVLLLHGVTDSWRSFETVLALLPPDVHAFAVTLRGHARASQPPTGYLYADLAADVAAFAEARAALHWEAPEAFTDDLVRFLRSCESRAPGGRTH